MKTSIVDAINAAQADIDDAKAGLGAVEEALENVDGLSNDVKTALLACFDHVAWSGTGCQSYYDALESALYPNTGLVRIEAVFTQGSAVVYPTTPLNDLKAYLVVTGYYSNGTSRVITDYTLFGTLATGTSTVTVAREGKTTTFNVTVSAPYWDYEWYSSSRTLPDGMTVTEYDFTTENGVLFAKTPKLDFEYTGNCKMQIEIKSYSENSNGQHVFAANNNPQFQIQNAVVSPNQFRGIKMVLDSGLGTSSEHGMVAVGINGTNSPIADSNSNEYHIYEITANNNVYELSIDGNPVTLTQNTDTTQYIAFTGIGCFQSAAPAFNGAFIKSIKFKRL